MSGYFLRKEDGHRWVLREVDIKIHSKDLEECRRVNKRCWEVPEMKQWVEQWVNGTSLNTRRNQLYFLLQREHFLKAAIDADGSDK